MRRGRLSSVFGGLGCLLGREKISYITVKFLEFGDRWFRVRIYVFFLCRVFGGLEFVVGYIEVVGELCGYFL